MPTLIAAPPGDQVVDASELDEETAELPNLLRPFGEDTVVRFN
jgi:hypothetical protein